MDLGLDRPGAREALHTAVDTIALTDERASELLAVNVGDIGEPGSAIVRLLEVLPDPPVDIRITMVTAVSTSRACLGQIRAFIVDGIPTTHEVLAILCRTALLASSRLLFIVGPEDEETRRINATRILRQESDSLQRLYKLAEGFKKLIALIPPADVIEQQKRRHDQLLSTTKKATESGLLKETAQIVGDLLLASGFDDGSTQPALSEHLLWIFNNYSGVAHGFGWPRLISTQPVPGDFIADLWITAAANQLAVDLLQKAHQGPEK